MQYIIVLFALIFVCLLFISKKKISKSVWSIKVFYNKSFLNNKLENEELSSPSLTAKDVTDVPALFVADPFIIMHDTKFYLFFEVLNKNTGKGDIGLATSDDAINWKYEKIVLSEKYHLSYPYVFMVEGNFYMIPESYQANKILLYKSVNFPYKWEICSELINGLYVDPSIFNYKNKWWMFAERDGDLYLFYSNNLLDGWVEHPENPIVSNNFKISRPAGRVIISNNEIFRYTQNIIPYYGASVKMFQVKRLSETEYEEIEINLVLSGSKIEKDWRRDGMHHIDQLQLDNKNWVIAVDGHSFKEFFFLKWKIEKAYSKLLRYLRFMNYFKTEK